MIISAGGNIQKLKPNINGKLVVSGDFGTGVNSVWPDGTSIRAYGGSSYTNGFTGILFDSIPQITPVSKSSGDYITPSGKNLVILSAGGNIQKLLPNNNGTLVPSGKSQGSLPQIWPSGSKVRSYGGSSSTKGWNGYLIDSNASGIGSPSSPIQSGGITFSMLAQDVLDKLNEINATIGMNRLSPEVVSKLEQNATITDGSVTANKMAQNTITTAQLNEQILKYLKPEITHSPQAPVLIFGGQTVTLLSQAEGSI